MAIMTKQEEGVFLSLFNRDGYVLDFTNNSFDVFTQNSVGIAIQSRYRMSKGRSLVAYLNEAADDDRFKLISDLFSYYEENMTWEFTKDYSKNPWEYHPSYDENYAAIYRKCKSIMDRINSGNAAILQAADELKDKFSSEYLSRQIELMVDMQTTNPTEAIGKAKELIESCCKTILDELGIEWSRKDDVPALTNKVMAALELLPANVNSTDQKDDSIKALLGNLRSIPTKLAEIRNLYGSGHGKSATYHGLEIRHAKLAVGSSITFVDFIWNTFEEQKKTERKGL